MKAIIFAALFFLIVPVLVLADGATTGSADPISHIENMRTVLHNAEFITESTAIGTITSVTSSNSAVVKAIQNELVTHSNELAQYIDGVSVITSQLPNGAQFDFSSSDAGQIEYLQAGGSSVLTGFLMGEMMEAMHEEGGMMGSFGMMSGFGMMNGGFFGGDTWYTNLGGGDSMMGFGSYGSGFGLGGIFMVLFWAVVIIGGIGFVAWIVKNTGTSTNRDALDILKERYAKGEVSKKEFEQKKKDLSL